MSLIWQQAGPEFEVPAPINLPEHTPFPSWVFRRTSMVPQALRLFEIEAAEIVWWNYGTVVFDRDGQEIPGLGLIIGERPPIAEIREQAARHLPGTTASLISWLPGNYSHILWESLPLIAALCEAGVLTQIDAVLSDAWADCLVSDVLKIYGSTAKIESVSGVGRATFDRLLVFESIHHPAHRGHPLFGRFFDRLRAKADEFAQNRHIIIERPHSRGFANPEALRRALPDFDVVSLEGRPPLLDQVRLFASARIAVVGHGAALSNLVFMRPAAGVVELFPRNYGTPAFWAGAGMRGIGYAACADAKGAGELLEDQKYEPIEVDVPAVVAAVDQLQKHAIQFAR